MLSCARASQLIPGRSDGLFSWQVILFRDMLVRSLLCAGKQKVLLVYSRSSRTRRDQLSVQTCADTNNTISNKLADRAK